MRRDIDSIIDGVSKQLPNVVVDQFQPRHAADDDGLWWFRLPDMRNEIQVESSNGMCPFMIEHDDMASSDDAVSATSVEVAVSTIVTYLGTAPQP